MAWVAAGSLKGPQGIQGLQGVDGPAGPAGTDGAQGIQGEQGAPGVDGLAGADGPQGPQGEQGTQGIGIRFVGVVDTEADLPATAEQGDLYIVQELDPNHGFVYDATTGAWVDAGPVQGPQGVPGADGPQGTAGVQGEQGIQGVQGEQGIDGPAGEQGSRGTGWFSGTGAPAEDIPGSMPGDLYLDTATGDVYTLS